MPMRRVNECTETYQHEQVQLNTGYVYMNVNTGYNESQKSHLLTF